MEPEALFGRWSGRYLVGMSKTRGTPQADEEFLESVENGQKPNSSSALGTNTLGTGDPSSKALEGMRGVATKGIADSGEDTWEGGAEPVGVTVPPGATEEVTGPLRADNTVAN